MQLQKVFAIIGITGLGLAGITYFFNGEVKLGALSLLYTVANIFIFLV